jgi:hypothetical protein
MHTTSPSDSTGLPSLRDADDTPIPFGGLVEQVAVAEEHGAQPFQLHMQGRVIGRDTHLLHVRFDQDKKTIALRPELVRVLTTDGA